MPLRPLDETHPTSPQSEMQPPSPGAEAVSELPAGDRPQATLSPWATSLLTIAPFFCWGTAMVAMKGVMPHTTPLFVAGFRLVPAGVLVLLATAIAGRPQPRGWTAWGWVALFAVVHGTLFQACLTEGLEYTGAGIGSVMIDSQPLIVAVLSCILFRERIGKLGWLGLAIGVVGIAAIGVPLSQFSGGAATGSVLGIGEAWMLLAALLMAIGTVMMPALAQHVDPIVATGWHMILGGVPLLVASAGWETQQWQSLIPQEWGALCYTAIVGSAIAYGLFFYFASRQNLVSLSSLTFLTPVVALIFGGWLLSESLTLQQWGGVILTLIGVWVISKRHDFETAIKTAIEPEA